jgi:hypothetical protein
MLRAKAILLQRSQLAMHGAFANAAAVSTFTAWRGARPMLQELAGPPLAASKWHTAPRCLSAASTSQAAASGSEALGQAGIQGSSGACCDVDVPPPHLARLKVNFCRWEQGAVGNMNLWHVCTWCSITHV